MLPLAIFLLDLRLGHVFADSLNLTVNWRWRDENDFGIVHGLLCEDSVEEAADILREDGPWYILGALQADTGVVCAEEDGKEESLRCAWSCCAAYYAGKVILQVGACVAV